ncbi:MAG: class I SAM-dependent methyltransferase [Saccharofermentanales bacterium]|jgi:arsenite methyltransferase
MRPDYKNWVPKGLMVTSFVMGLIGVGVGLWMVLSTVVPVPWRWIVGGLLLLAGGGLFGFGGWCVYARAMFDHDGRRHLAKDVVEGIAERVELHANQTVLDVGCGSGALTIAVAKRHPEVTVIGVDRWGKEYDSFSQALCEANARAEGVHNVSFMPGDAKALPFPDATFDAVVSNYVYHNIPARDRRALLRETLRVLKKGGVFAIHDIMSPRRFGDMQAFEDALRREGYACVRRMDTTDGDFMTRGEAARLFLKGSTLLTGRK